jgi:hypothetical protein
MASAEQELQQFTEFVRNQIGAGETSASLEELFDRWRFTNLSAEDYANDVAAIAASIDDFKRGERGTIAGEHSDELRRKFGLLP